MDIIRGFALTGVLFANFMAYVDQQIPESTLHAISGALDLFLVKLNKVFLEWKFMTLFSILFGYGFGLILESLERKGISPHRFFFRRMGWLFLMGCVHTLFWWGDVLHLYAMSGMLLFLFRKSSARFILFAGLCCALILPLFIRFLFRNQPETFTEADLNALYLSLRNGSLLQIIKFNIEFYYRMFVVSGNDIHDIIQTLGRFLLGYYLLRIRLFDHITEKQLLFKRILYVSLTVTMLYLCCRMFSWEPYISDNAYVVSLALSIGILAATTFYVTSLVLTYLRFGQARPFEYLRSIGRMTLTNYAMVSIFMVFILYGFGLGLLGSLPIHIIWIFGIVFFAFECIFSSLWLRHFRYGPFEWIWRIVSLGKKIPLKK